MFPLPTGPVQYLPSCSHPVKNGRRCKGLRQTELTFYALWGLWFSIIVQRDLETIMFGDSCVDIVGAWRVGLPWVLAFYKTQIFSLNITLSYCYYGIWMDKGRNYSLLFFLVLCTRCLHALDLSGLLKSRLLDIKEFLNQTTITLNPVGLELFQIFALSKSADILFLHCKAVFSWLWLRYKSSRCWCRILWWDCLSVFQCLITENERRIVSCFGNISCAVIPNFITTYSLEHERNWL